jgi:dTMP kinase
MDYYLQIWTKLLICSVRNQNVILDRYIYDTVINDLSAQLDFSGEQTLQVIKQGLGFLPEPDFVALIDLPEEVAFARKTDIPHINYLRERRLRYLELSHLGGIEFFDGQRDPDTLLNDILKSINRQSGG